MKYSKLEYIDATCPLCGNLNAQVLQIFNSEDVAKFLEINENDPKFNLLTAHVEKLWGTNICYFVRCINCSFDFAVPNISGDSEFYSMVYNNAFNYPPWKWEFEIGYNVIKEIILKNANNNFKLLEIGAGNGNFLKKIVSLIPKENILATEFSSAGKNEISNYGIKCLSLEIHEIDKDEYKEYFDFICLFQVLEHINNINVFFNHLSWRSKEGANLLIAVPNNIYRLHFMNLGLDEEVPPIHVGRWNKQCFNSLAERHGWVVINHIIQPLNYFETISKYIFKEYKGTPYLKLPYNIRNKIIRKIVLGIFIIPLIILNIKIIFNFYKKDLGVSQFVHLRKNLKNKC